MSFCSRLSFGFTNQLKWCSSIFQRTKDAAWRDSMFGVRQSSTTVRQDDWWDRRMAVRKWKPKPDRWQRDEYWAGPFKPVRNHWAKKIIKSQGNCLDEKPVKAPSKVHLVTRVKRLKGEPYWNRETLTRLGMVGPKHKNFVVANTPANNAMLKSVSHLVRVIPLSAPYGLPETEAEFHGTQVTTDGRFVVKKTLKPINESDPKMIEPSDDPNSKKLLDEDCVNKVLIKKKQNYGINEEYHDSHYEYQYNQDGKEWVYKAPKHFS